eukprot:4554952-Pyramimonas_sp.AAC.1
MRARAATCSGLWAPGACTNTLLGLLGAAKDDPQFRLRYEQLNGWALAWADLGHKSRRACAGVWMGACTKMDQTKCRWQVVRGPMAATIAALRDLGWQAESP